MTSLFLLSKKVDDLYTNPHPGADPWISWAYKNHLLIVVKNSEKIAKAKKANVEFCIAGALLHDIADTEMSRFKEGHEKRSLELADELLRSSDFSEEETKEIISEIIAPHSCRDTTPQTLEGKVMATADAVAHFEADFYTYFCWQHLGIGKDYTEFKSWVISSIEKNFTKKIFFDDVREEVRKDYEALKLIFSK